MRDGHGITTGFALYDQEGWTPPMTKLTKADMDRASDALLWLAPTDHTLGVGEVRRRIAASYAAVREEARLEAEGHAHTESRKAGLTQAWEIVRRRGLACLEAGDEIDQAIRDLTKPSAMKK